MRRHKKKLKPAISNLIQEKWEEAVKACSIKFSSGKNKLLEAQNSIINALSSNLSNSKKYASKLGLYALLSATLNMPAATLKSPENSETELFAETTIPKDYTPKRLLGEQKEYLLGNYGFGDLEQRINSKKIPVLMFHEIGIPENRYRISPSNFRNILDDLRQDNYFLVTLEEFKKGNFSRVPTGKKPLLLTFDDAGKGQFEYVTGTRIINPRSAIGILEEYKEKHPEFGSGGIFFISYSGDDHNFRKPFMQDEKVQDKLGFLLENGYDIGWHAPYHNNNANATSQDIKNQVFKLDAFLYYSTKGKIEEQSIRSYAHPFGATPRNNDAMEELNESFELIFNAWGGMSYHPLSKKFDNKRIPRIEMHTSNINLVLGKNNAYTVESGDRFFYKSLAGEISPRIEKMLVRSTRTD